MSKVSIQSLLAKLVVDEQADMIVEARTLPIEPADEHAFPDAVPNFALACAKDAPPAPVPSSSCGACQFKVPSTPPTDQPKSGFMSADRRRSIGQRLIR